MSRFVALATGLALLPLAPGCGAVSDRARKISNETDAAAQTDATAQTDAAAQTDDGWTFTARFRDSRDESSSEEERTDTPVERSLTWNPRRTAIVVCDMWDDHWCRGAAERVAEMAPHLDRTLERARQRGLLVVHAPSTCMAPYEGTPARERARNAPHVEPATPLESRERWGTAWCWPDDREGDLPIDDSDMGCDCVASKGVETSCTIREAWTRQIDTIRIDPDRDAVTDNGQEIVNLFAARGIENVILCGVHLNMCVLGRPFAIRQMVQQGKNVLLLRDLTDTMYNSQRAPRVSHFEGTDLVVSHVETHWCPSATSTILTGEAPFRFRADPPR